jgi:hypothetical protein
MKSKIFIFGIFIFGILYIIYDGLYIDFPSKKFDPIEWGENFKVRKKMAKDIINSKMFIGKDKLYLESQLGNINKDDRFDNVWTSSLGYKGILSAKYYYLSFTFEDNLVKNVVIKETEYD